MFEQQVRLLGPDKNIIMSLPNCFKIPEVDANLLKSLNVQIIRSDPSLSIGEAIVDVIEKYCPDSNSALEILYGDTLLSSIPDIPNTFVSAKEKSNYNWAHLEGIAKLNRKKSNKFKNIQNEIIAGYFNISFCSDFLDDLAGNNFDFVYTIQEYIAAKKLENINHLEWYDFGHTTTYYSSKRAFTTERSFNKLEIQRNVVTKTSNDINKIQAEAMWYDILPKPLKIYTPQFLGAKSGEDFAKYSIEYLHLTPLNELFVFGDLPNFVWQEIIDACFRFLKDTNKHYRKNSTSQNFVDLVTNKTNNRLRKYCEAKSIELSAVWDYNGKKASLTAILSECYHILRDMRSTGCETIIHGDFCFSNILYDFRSQMIKVIDPRGLSLTDEKTIYGDKRYDIGKLAHSIIGRYDEIVAGRANVNINKYNIEFSIHSSVRYLAIEQYLLDWVTTNEGVTKNQLLAIQINLFFSMLPLHNDNPKRQEALFANAFRLYFDKIDH